MSKQSLSRRSFIKGMTTSGAGLVVACQLPMISGCAARLPHRKENAWEPNAWLQITPSNDVIFYLHCTEMGQGTFTGLTTLIAEELKTAPHLITVKTSGVHPDYINPTYGIQITGGSTSIKNTWDPLRVAAATTREMLTSAAANRWGTATSNCRVENKQVIFGEKTFNFGELSNAASELSPPKNPALTPKDSYQYIGKQNQRLDSKMKAAGTATFGIDAGVPFAHKAALLRCPVRGGKVRSYDASKALIAPGIIKIVAIDNGIAAIADSWWRAKKALELIAVEWEYPELKNHSSDSISKQYQEILAEETGTKARKNGDGANALAQAASVHRAVYEVPYLAHATMEPMNCTVDLQEDHCEVWAPTQGPDVAAGLVEEATGLRRSQIKINTTLMGGGFGRRLNQDYVFEAAQIARASGLTVQLIWSREEDTKYDFYRPAVMANIEAGLNSDGSIDTWSYKSTGPSIMSYTFQEAAGAVLPAWFPDGLVRATGNLGPTIYGGMMLDHSSVEGSQEYHYDTPNVEVRYAHHDVGLPVGFWRSVGHSFNGFFLESFMDELAHNAKADPVDYRLQHLSNNPRQQQTLKLLKEKSNWSSPAKPGRYRGVASYPSFHSYISQMAEISVDNNEITVHRVVCVLDCGTVINPDIVKMQIESGIVFGLTAALKGEITLKDGEVQQSNFHDYQLLRLTESPEIEIHVIDSDEPPTGVGEPGVPPIAAAVANAYFAATGKRLRKLPLTTS